MLIAVLSLNSSFSRYLPTYQHRSRKIRANKTTSLSYHCLIEKTGAGKLRKPTALSPSVVRAAWTLDLTGWVSTDEGPPTAQTMAAIRRFASQGDAGK